ncbi:hypothetical protein Scep_028434 [Stephania cephalantha]|uniref:Uncharacterized protein n=1 Tax=Stephania cephalantha TaxID=152367 RepID=A0AAP0HLT8_9MAGN
MKEGERKKEIGERDAGDGAPAHAARTAARGDAIASAVTRGAPATAQHSDLATLQDGGEIGGETRQRPAVCAMQRKRCAPIGSANGRAGVSNASRAVAPRGREKAADSTGSDAP